MKRVFICSAHSMFTEGLLQLIEKQSDLDVVGCEDSLETALEQIRGVHPDVVLFVKGDGPYVDDRQILEAMGGKTQIIELNYENELVSVISGGQLVVSEFAELVRLIG